MRALVVRALLALLSVVSWSGGARADYLEVRHSALLKEDPERQGKTRVKLEVGEQLALLRDQQTNGYYFASTRSGKQGFVYRTLARRFPGDLPEPPDNSDPDDGGPGDPGDAPDDSDPGAPDDGSTDLGPEIPAYDRKHWRHWVDDDGDCQSTRDEVLIAESLVPVTFTDERKCKVASGRWRDPYGGEVFTDPKKLDVDHMVPLQNAHLSGGWAWTAADRRTFANNLDEQEHLIAVSASLNRQKGARGPETWKPPAEDYWCQYARDWQAIKQRWALDMTVRESEAVTEMLETCP